MSLRRPLPFVLCTFLALTAAAPVAWAQEAPTEQASKEWAATLQLFSTQLAAVNEADRNLTMFTSNNKLTPKGKERSKSLAAKLDTSRQELQTTIDAIALFSKRPKTTIEDAAKFRTANAKVLSDAGDAVQAERAAEQEPTFVDRTAEEAAARRAAAERARAEQEASRREAEERRKAEEERKRTESEQRRKAEEERRRTEAEQRRAAEEDKRKAEAEARRRAEEEKRTAAAAAAAAAAHETAQAEQKARADVDARLSALEKATRAMADRVRESTDNVAAFLARPTLTIDARGAGVRHQRALEEAGRELRALDKRVTDTRAMPVKQAAAVVGALQADIERTTRTHGNIVEAARATITSPKSFLTGIVPPLSATPAASASSAAPEPAPRATAPSRTEDVVPMCEFAFEPTGDSKGMTVSVDGSAQKSLPLRVRLASGRHTLFVKKDKAVQERRELLLCGHVAVVPIDPPR